MAVIASIDGPARRINLHADTVDSSWEPVELYREYRLQRRTDETLRRFDPLLLMAGNIPKGGGKATPRYMLLIDGTRIVPFDASGVTTVAGEIITDDQSEPFDFSTLTQPMVVDKQPTDAEIVYIETPSPIQDRLDYGDTIRANSSSGFSGQVHPFGTSVQPVDNLVDVVALSALTGLSRVSVKGQFVQGAADLSNLDLIGANPERDWITCSGSLTEGASLDFLFVTGAANGSMLVRNSVISALTGFRGIAHQVAIGAGGLSIDAAHTGVVQILGCFSGVAGIARPFIDCNSANCALSVRDYFGGLNIRNFNQGNNASFDFSSAVIQIEATCTDGVMKFYGGGRVLDANGDQLPTGTSTINGNLTVVNETVSNESVAEQSRSLLLGTESFP